MFDFSHIHFEIKWIHTNMHTYLETIFILRRRCGQVKPSPCTCRVIMMMCACHAKFVPDAAYDLFSVLSDCCYFTFAQTVFGFISKYVKLTLYALKGFFSVPSFSRQKELFFFSGLFSPFFPHMVSFRFFCQPQETCQHWNYFMFIFDLQATIM